MIVKAKHQSSGHSQMLRRSAQRNCYDTIIHYHFVSFVISVVEKYLLKSVRLHHRLLSPDTKIIYRLSSVDWICDLPSCGLPSF